MKKLFVICLALVMAFAMTATMALSVGAGDFLASPSRNQAPELIFGQNEKGDKVGVTSYADRNDMPAEARRLLEEAYAKILGTADVSALNSRIGEIAKEMGIDVAGLAISDLFDLSPVANADGTFSITLKAETLQNFVCLLHYHGGEWQVVEGAKLTNNGEHLEFSVDSFSPFAIVVNTGAVPAPAGMSTALVVGIVVSSVLLVGGIVTGVCLLTVKKKA